MTAHQVLRQRGHHAPVTFEELFFDLVYVFAVTQLSHQLLQYLGISLLFLIKYYLLLRSFVHDQIRLKQKLIQFTAISTFFMSLAMISKK